MLLSFLLVVVGWIIFRAESIEQAYSYLFRISSHSLFDRPDASGITGLSLAIAIMLLMEWCQRKRPHAFDLSYLHQPVVRCALDVAVILLIIVLGGPSENFIYFQF